MSRFTSLPSVLFDSDGRPLRAVDEVALVIGLVAGTLREKQGQQATAARTRGRRSLALSIITLVVLAGLLLWWLQREGRNDLLLPAALLAALLLLLLVIGALLTSRPRPERDATTAAVTRVGRAYWPVGILPLEGGASLLWDPLSAPGEPLERLTIPADLGAESEESLGGADRLGDAYDALLGFDSALSGLRAEPVRFPAAAPDESLRRLGAESDVLWRLLDPIEPQRLAATLPPPNGMTWEEVAESADRLAAFHRSRPDDEAALRAVQARAEGVTASMGEILIDRHWRVRSEMEAERAAAFAPNSEEGPPTHPGGVLPATAASSASDLQQSLGRLDDALAPLRQALEGRRTTLNEGENAERERAAARFEGERTALGDLKQRLDLVDSEIVEIGGRLQSQQERIHEYAATTQETFGQLAALPLGEVHQQLAQLNESVREAEGIIGSVSGKIDVAALAEATAQLGAASQAAHDAWATLAREMPQRSASVQERTERMLTELSAIPKIEGSQSIIALRNLESSLREVERVTRAVVSWAAAQEDPIEVIEDKHRELEAHVVGLRAQRSELETAQELLVRLNDPAIEGAGALPAGLEQASRVMRQYQNLSDQVSSTVRAMDNAAELVKMQSEQLERLLRDRDSLRQKYEAALADIARREAREEEERVARTRAAIAEMDRAIAPLDAFQQSSRERVERLAALPGLSEMGRIAPQEPGEWPDRVANDLGLGIEAWGQQVAGIEAPPESTSRLAALGQALGARHEALRSRAVPTALPDDAEPVLAFIPFWLVESMDASGSEAGRRFHLFPPAQLGERRPTEMPALHQWLLPEASRRLLAHVAPGVALPEGVGPVTFEPGAMSEAARALDLAPAQVPPGELATALAQHWLFFRSEDEQLNAILLNSRNHLIPEQRILEAWERSAPPTSAPRLPAIASSGGARPVEHATEAPRASGGARVFERFDDDAEVGTRGGNSAARVTHPDD